MPLGLIYITNDPAVALVAEKYGVDYIMIDMETLGKEERQKNMDTVKLSHTVDDVKVISRVLKKSKTLVRVNPWHENSVDEIESVISAGADIIMLPMWKSFAEVDSFLNLIHGRVRTTLLLETKEAVEILDDILSHPFIDEIHIGLNDLHLSYGLTFMFELLSNGVVESICCRCNEAGIEYGFGGIARIGEGMLPAERIVMEHYRLGSTRVILSRGFCNVSVVNDIDAIDNIFAENIAKLREVEKSILNKEESELMENMRMVKCCVSKIVEKILESKQS